MAMSRETLLGYLTDAFPEAEITLTDLAGDDNHWQAEIVSWHSPREAAPIGLFCPERHHGGRTSCAGPENAGTGFLNLTH